MDLNPDQFNLLVGFIYWLFMFVTLAAGSLILAFIFSIARNGQSGRRRFWAGLKSYVSDIRSISPRRILAITNLTIKEAIRRKSLLVFVVFAVLLMFAGWFISNSNERAELQVNVHITFVLTTIAWLILPAVIFLSCWGIPEDIRLRSLHTVVTKPARRLEIVVGRMLGFSMVTVLVLFVMAVVGYVWIERQVPENVRDRLTCRVPVFGMLYFVDIDGKPQRSGVNVGDIWMYRSYIQGNTRARAIWVFNGITPDTIGDKLILESRFEAFRTNKGTEKSVREGLEAQYTLVHNPRDLAFSDMPAAASMKDFSDALKAGQFRAASDRIADLAERIRSSPDDIPAADFSALTAGLVRASEVLAIIDEPLKPAAAKMAQLGKATSEVGKSSDASGKAAFEAIAVECEGLSEFLKANADDLQERLARLEIPLPSFGVSEFHEGDNVMEIPRKIRATADSETLTRFLASRVDELNKAGRLAENGQLSASAAERLAEAGPMSLLNAELLTAVLSEQISSGALNAADNQLSIVDGRRWFAFFDDLVRRDLLVSSDTEGWELEFDLFEDLTRKEILRVEVSCLDDQMYLGMAAADLFVRLPDRPFLVGYSKAIITTGLMLLLVVVIGVTASCVVKGPVAVFFTLTTFIVGQFFREFLERIAAGEEGTGLIQSATMILQHRTPQVGMDASEVTQNVVKGLDQVSQGMLWVASRIIPDFGQFSTASTYVEKGFDVPLGASVVPCLALFLGFLIPCVLLAGACLKFRELESK
jgi:hypothetical protein